MNRVQSVVVGIVVAMFATACGAGPEGSPAGPDESAAATALSNLGGDGLPVQQSGENYNHPSLHLTGSLTLQDNGCWTADLGDGPRLVVFPQGFAKPPEDGLAMQAPDGLRIESGMAIDAIGGIVSADGFPGTPDGFWGNYLSFCEPQLEQLVVLDAVTPAFQPDRLQDSDWVAMLEAADLNVSWECGLGFSASTEDQRVAVSVHPIDATTLTPPILLPDDTWQAVVIIGKNLMVHNCDDVVEGWEPSALVVARWPIVAGTLDFSVPADTSCGDVSVTGMLSGAVAETPLGPVNLSPLEFVNNAYGCFAG